jgi:hypothetical protein
MKNFTSFRSLFLVVSMVVFGAFASNAQCTYEIVGDDTFGDGWNGCSVGVTVDGVPVVGSPFTFTSGSTATWNFTVSTGQTIELTWNVGSFNNEASFNLFDSDGILVHANPTNSAGGVVYTGLGNCPPCPAPSNLSVSNVLDVSTDLSWTGPTNGINYTVEWGTPGFIPGTGTQLGMVSATTNTTETATGLTALTNYEFYVMTDCGAIDGTSTWAGPFSWLTACTVYTPAWTDDVEMQPSSNNVGNSLCWNGTNTTSYDWNVTTNGTTGSFNTGAPSAHSGTNYFYTEASGAGVGNIATLQAPNFDASGMTYPTIKFWYHMTGGQMGDLAVEAWDGVSWNQVDILIGEQQNTQADPWLQRTIYLPTAYANMGFTFRFVATSNGSYEGDICIDDISLTEAPSCPEPMSINLTGSDLTSASMDWTLTPISMESEWELEYGPMGFTPGTGTTMQSLTNPDTITGLTSNMFYEVYVQSVCGVGDSSVLTGPLLFNTFDQGLYMEQDNACATWVDLSTSLTATDAALDYSGELDITLPWAVLHQGTPVTDATISSSGHLLFNSPNYITQTFNQTIAAAPHLGLYPFWDALDPIGNSGGAVYYETIGTAPNRTFIVQWETVNYISGPAGEDITFQLQIDEATGEYYFVYEDAIFGGSDANWDNGNSATIGVKTASQDVQTSYNNPTYLENNSCAHYYYTDCPMPSNFAVSYTTTDEAAITWGAGISGETEWTVIYGPEGFDPATSGTTVSGLTATALIIPGLNDITTYDVYIYADCNPTVLQSAGMLGQFTTMPNCADPTMTNAIAAEDSIFTDWMWTANPGYNISEFGVQYGWTGFTPGNGTTYFTDTLSYTDTTYDASLIGGGVYDVYIQAVCGTDSSNWVGPVSITMPLTNDSTCFAEDLAVDGTMYTFDNSGATIDAGEATITPPGGDCQSQMGWCNSNINSTVWYTFTAPPSGNVRVNCAGINFDGQVAAYEVTDCNDFSTYTLIGANDDAPGFYNPPLMNLCGLTPGMTYYLMYDSYSTVATGTYNMTLSEVVVEAGTDNGLTNICLGDTLDLTTQITGADAGGTWIEAIPTAGFEDPYFVSAGLASQQFDFHYVVVDGCASDTVWTSAEVYAPSSAGSDGTITVCMNEPVDLLHGLSGNVDLGGTWYDPSNSVTQSDIVAGSIPGLFNYDYVTGNGVCPDDTANVILTVDGACDYLNLQELYFEGMDLYPNPTTNAVYISNSGSNEVFNYELTDLNGKVIAAKEAAINGTETTEVSVETLETGIYLIRVYNDNAEKTFRIVKQ